MKIINALFYGMIAIFSSTIALGLNTFEIMNKSKTPIWVSVFSDNQKKIDVTEVTGKTFSGLGYSQKKIDTSRPITLLIWTYNPGKNAISRGSILHVFGKEEFKPTPSYIYEFKNTTNKDIFVTFNPGAYSGRGDLYPQTGSLFGLSGTSESKLSLKNNITRDNIVLLEKR